jgi:hypothetical protein
MPLASSMGHGFDYSFACMEASTPLGRDGYAR